EEPLPAPWRAGRRVAAIVVGRRLLRRRQGEEVVLGRHPAVLDGSRVGHLRERHVLGEAARRELPRLAREEREERAAGGIGARRAACEEDRDRGAAERFLDVRSILAARAE